MKRSPEHPSRLLQVTPLSSVTQSPLSLQPVPAAENSERLGNVNKRRMKISKANTDIQIGPRNSASSRDGLQHMMNSPTKPQDHDLKTLQEQVEQLQQQLVQAQKLGSVGALASSITHEFNNILTTVINYAKMGLRHKDEATRDKAFDKILSAGQRAAKITKGVLSYARQSSDRREPTSLIQMVQDVMLLVEKDLQMNRIRWQTDFYDDVFADVNPNQIQQVLMNLIVNARQAMQEGGQLTVSVRRNDDGNWAEVSVKDTGSGIPADKLRSIFEPFFTTKVADENGQGGTGLGLATCRNIVESHRGRVRVESTVGKGTTMTLKFPAVANPLEAVPKAG